MDQLTRAAMASYRNHNGIRRLCACDGCRLARAWLHYTDELKRAAPRPEGPGAERSATDATSSGP